MRTARLSRDEGRRVVVGGAMDEEDAAPCGDEGAAGVKLEIEHDGAADGNQVKVTGNQHARDAVVTHFHSGQWRGVDVIAAAAERASPRERATSGEGAQELATSFAHF
jgi:hypothetical protein